VYVLDILCRCWLCHELLRHQGEDPCRDSQREDVDDNPDPEHDIAAERAVRLFVHVFNLLLRRGSSGHGHRSNVTNRGHLKGRRYGHAGSEARGGICQHCGPSIDRDALIEDIRRGVLTEATGAVVLAGGSATCCSLKPAEARVLT